MGEVYRAHDPHLHRDVAIKVLSSEFLDDVDRLRRFEQEAWTAASVNHPEVLAVYDVGTSPDGPYIVTELLEGETLEECLERGPMQLREAAQIAAGVARGLAAVHNAGIIHRDLKPSNVFLTRGRQVKLFDFGIAKLLQPNGNPAGEIQITVPGRVLGTPSHMSPEQARGQPADARSDIFALGVILYEVLSGEKAFEGSSVAETMAAIVQDAPPKLEELAGRLPAALGYALRRCLEKDPEMRFQSAGDLAFHLERIARAPTTPIEGLVNIAASPPKRILRWIWLSALVVALAAIAALFVLESGAPAAQPPQLHTVTFSDSDSLPAAASGGDRIVFTSGRDGISRIWLKELAKGYEVALTDGSDSAPRISPDGAEVLFVREESTGRRTLFRVPIVGGEPRRLLREVQSADWSPDGRQIVFLRRVHGLDGPAMVLGVASVDEFSLRELTRLPSPFYVFPRWSPNGRWIALGHGGAGVAGEVLLVTSDGGAQRVLDTGFDGRVCGVAWSGDRDLIIAQAEALSAGQRTTPARIQYCRIDGRCRTILHVAQMGKGLDVLGDAAIVFGTESTSQNLVELPLDGEGELERWLTRGSAVNRQPTYSPDGEWIAFSSERSGSLDLWVISRTTGNLRRFTVSTAEDWDPAWTADGRQLLWSSNRSGHFEIWMAMTDGGEIRRITRAERNFQNPSATPNGKWITFVSFDDETRGLWKVRADGSDAAQLVKGDLRHPELSPDGQFVLFHRPLSGGVEQLRVVRLEDGKLISFEVRFPSFSGAGRGRWLPDGSGIAFVGLDDRGRSGIFVQDFRPGHNTDATRRVAGGFQAELWTESFGISPDGRRLTLALKEPRMNLTVARNVRHVTARRMP